MYALANCNLSSKCAPIAQFANSESQFNPNIRFMHVLPSLDMWRLYEIMPTPCLILQPDLQILTANDAYAAEAGLSKDDISGSNFFEIIHAEEHAEKQLKKSFKKLSNQNAEDELGFLPFYIKSSDNAAKGLFWNIKNILVKDDKTGEPFIFHFAVKVSLQENSRNFDLLIDSIRSYAIILLDKEGTITKWNSAASELTGYTENEAIGKNMAIFYTNEEQNNGLPQKNLEEALKLAQVQIISQRIKKDGTPMYVHIALTALLDASGNHYGFVKIIRDISKDREEAERTRFLADITRNIEDPIIATDNNMVITRWNQAAERLFGWPEAEAIGKSTREVLKAQMDEDVRESIIRRLDHINYWQGEVGYRNKKGKLIDGICTLSNFKDEQGNITGYLILIQDISKIKKVERELGRLNADLEQRVEDRTKEILNNEKRYRSLFENNPVPMWVMEQNSLKILDVNEMACLQYGYTQQEFLSMTTLDLMDDDQKQLFTQFTENLQPDARNYNKAVWAHHTKDGNVMQVEVVAHEIIFENVPAIIILANNITERIKVEKELAAREIFFRSIIENSAEGISLIDASYNIIYRSPAALKISKNFQNTPWENIHPEDVEMMENKRRQLFEMPGVPIAFLARLKNSADDYVWLEGVLNNLLHVDGVNAIVINFRNVTEKIISEEKLAASEKRFKILLDNMLEGAQIVDYEWNYVYVNDALVASSKYSREQLLGSKMIELYPGITETEVFKVLTTVMKTRIPKVIETPFTFPDGIESFFLLSIQPVPEGIFILSVDITERKNTEAIILKSQESVRTIHERISDAFFAVDRNFNYTYMNNAACAMINRRREDLIGKNAYDEYPDLVGHNLEKAFMEALQTQQYVNIEEYYEPLDLWLQADIYPSEEGLSLFFRDVSQRKRAELKLLQSQENMKAIFDNSSEGFILTDKEGIIKVFNNNVVDSILMGVSDNIKEGASIFNAVDQERWSFFKQVFKKVLSGETVQYNRKYHKKNGVVTWVNLMINPVLKNGEILGVCITGRDVTEEKNAAEKLEESFKANLALSQRLSTIINTLPANIALLDSKGTIREVNKAWAQFDSHSFKGKNYSVGKNYIEVSRSIDEKADDNITMARGVSAVLQSQLDEFVYEYSLQQDGIEKWFRMMVTPLKEKEDNGAVIMHMDISELRRLEAERIRQQREQQQKITKAIIQGQEKERIYIGMELHDNINQKLAGTRMYLEIAGSKSDEVKQSIQYPLQLLDESIEEIRALTSGMVTSLKNVPLEDMIRELLSKFTRYKLTYDLSYDVPTDDLSDELKLNLYRIIQELSQNITKHANATLVTIKIWTDDGNLNMLVTDNGKGFDTNAKRNGIGVSNIYNRVKSFNGIIRTDSTTGKGTQTSISIPYLENS